MSAVQRILLVDDHQMFREGIRARLNAEPDFDVVGEAGSSEEALRAMEEQNVDIVLLDIRMPKVSGVDLARALKKRWPDVRIVVLSGYDFEQYVRAMARIGIEGYLLKDSPQDALIDALREVAKGGVVLPPAIASKVMRDYSSGEPVRRHLWELTLREIEVLEHLAQDKTNGEIAADLGISPRTAETHVRNIISKLGADSRADAARIAAERGLIK